MKRKPQVAISREQYEILKSIAEITGVPITVQIRKAIAAYLNPQSYYAPPQEQDKAQ